MRRYRMSGVVFLSLIFMLTGIRAFAATHDIAIERIEVDPRVPSVGERFKIEGLAKNLGEREEKDVEIAFSVDGTQTGLVNVSLKSGDEKWVHEFDTRTDAGEHAVSVRSLLSGDENPANDMQQIVLAAIGDEDDGGDSGDDDGGDDDDEADDPDDDDDDGGDEFFEGAYYVHVENHTRATVRFDFSLDSRDYDHSLELAPGASRSSDTFRTDPGFHTCYARWRFSDAGDWYYSDQTGWIRFNEVREFSFEIDPVQLRLEGRVVGADGPLADAGVTLLADGRREDSDETDDAGRFSFSGLEFGDVYSLEISREGYLDTTRDVGRLASDVDLGDIRLEAVVPPDDGSGGDAPGDDEPGDDEPGDDEPPPPVDADGDGVADNEDAFPSDPGESVDTDGDGIGDNADEDDDNDGIPDSWERDHGLDPMADDAAGDPDGDGVTNLNEYLAGTDPNHYEENLPPGVPELLAPAEGAEGLSIELQLETGGFADPDGDPHARTRWQIADNPHFSLPAFDRESEKFLTRLDVPNLVLMGETTYYWRVQYIDLRGAASRWSEAGSFATGPWAADANRNGISDAVEHTEYSDLDANGTSDLDQEDIQCVMAARESGRVLGVFCPQSAGTIECLDVVNHSDIPDETDRPPHMPFNLVNFRVKLTRPGESVRLRIYLSEALTGDAGWFKYDPLIGWINFTESAAIDGGQVVEIEIRDGGDGDIDGVANGVIVDPSGIGTEAATYRDGDDDDDDSSGWYVGCFIRGLYTSICAFFN